MTNNIYLSFDFSMNKPAATLYYAGKIYFWFWPLGLKQKHCDVYGKYGVHVTSRNLPSIDTKNTETSALALTHTIRSTDLANLIISQIDDFIETEFGFKLGDEYDLYVCSEGLSFASKGDATLNLATYKGVLLSKIYEHYGDNLKRIFTYAPNSLKSTAGCAPKELRGDKKNMINAFLKQPLKSTFKDAIKAGEFTLKTNYMDGIDDIVDSYWALKTMIEKEKLPL